MKVDLKQLRALSIWIFLMLFFGWLFFIAYIVLSYHDFGLDQTAFGNVHLSLLIIFPIFLIIGFISSVFIASILNRKSRFSYINIIPIFLCLPAIILCNKYIREWRNNTYNQVPRFDNRNLSS